MVTRFDEKIEEKKEANLHFIADRLGISFTEIEEAQEKHLNPHSSLVTILGINQFFNVVVPEWLNYKKAEEIFEELRSLTSILYEGLKEEIPNE